MSCKVNELILKTALESDNLKTLEEWIENGLSPNHVLPLEGYSLLHLAVGLCDIDMVNMLLKSNANPNIWSSERMTPVHLSAYWDFDIPLRLLLMAGGDPYLCDITGKNTFEIASEEESAKCMTVLQDFTSQGNKISNHVLGPASSFTQSTVLFPDPDSDRSTKMDPTTFNKAFNLDGLDENVQYNLLSEGNLNGLMMAEYLYEDSVEKIAFLETRFPRSTSVSSCSTSISDNTLEDCLQPTFSRVDQAKPSILPNSCMTVTRSKCSLARTINNCNDNELYSKLNDLEILEELKKLGMNPGPITKTTRNVYLKMLIRLKLATERSKSRSSRTYSIPVLETHSKGQTYTVEKPLSCYPEELILFISKPDDTWQDQFLSMEREICHDFEQPGIRWKEGNNKTAFNYLLLDSRLTKNLPSRLLTSTQQMEVFVQAIFYVGKGTRARPLSHLYEAASVQKKGKSAISDKVKKICEIWSSGCGVVNLYCFQNVIPAEALTRESCMICALGLKNLTNIRRGETYGVVSQWPLRKKRLMGVFLLFRALNILINEGERQIRLTDIYTK